MVRKRTARGRISFEIRYADYHDIGGVMFAYKVDADFPAAQTRVSFAYKRPIVNGKIADSVFTLTPGPGREAGRSRHASASPSGGLIALDG